MKPADLRDILDAVARGGLVVEAACDQLLGRVHAQAFEDLGFARIDHQRELRQGFPEVVFGPGKTPGQVAEIASRIVARSQALLVTRVGREVFEAVRERAAKRCETSEDRIFPISHESARIMVAKAGKKVGVPLRPHDLRRYAATYAPRSGVPIEIVSKEILRHSNLSTTQRYLGKITDTEAMKWIENLYA